MTKLPEDFIEKLNSVKNKRARFVIDRILQHSYCSTEDIKDAGYEHAPRAARDVRELGIPLDTFRVKDREGKSIAAYKFGDWEEYKKQNLLSKTSGRTQLSNKLKGKLISKFGSKCFLYNEEYPEQLLQVDHRIPFEIAGEQDDSDIGNFMLLSPSGNRAKSWACENCINWASKDISLCATCYYAYPENYTHIAGTQERKIDIIFKDNDVILYDYLKQKATKKDLSLQEMFKSLIKEDSEKAE